MDSVRSLTAYFNSFSKRAATSIQRFYRFHKGLSKSREEVLPPPCSPFIPPVYNTPLNSNDCHTHEESEERSSGVQQFDSSASRKTKDSNVSNYKSHVYSFPIGAGSSGMVGRSRTSSDKTSSNTLKDSLGSRDVWSHDFSCSTLDMKLHSSRSLAKTSRSHEPSSQEASSLEPSSQEASLQSSDVQKVTRHMKIDLIKLESSATGTIENATCDVTVDSGLGLGRFIFILSSSDNRN